MIKLDMLWCAGPAMLHDDESSVLNKQTKFLSGLVAIVAGSRLLESSEPVSCANVPGRMHLVGSPALCDLRLAEQGIDRKDIHKAPRRPTRPTCCFETCSISSVRIARTAGKRDQRCIRVANRIIRRVCYLCLGTRGDFVSTNQQIGEFEV